MNEQMKHRMRRDVLRILDSIKEALDEDIPDFLLAERLTRLFWVSLGYLPADVSNEFGRLLTQNARRYVCLCADPKCDNNIPIYRAHQVYCDKCEAQTMADVFNIEMELQKDEPRQETT